MNVPKEMLEESKKVLSQRLGCTLAEADDLLAKIDVRGWAWAPASSPAIVGTIFCACGVIAEVSDPSRLAPNCPNCGRAWKIATVQ